MISVLKDGIAILSVRAHRHKDGWKAKAHHGSAHSKSRDAALFQQLAGELMQIKSFEEAIREYVLGTPYKAL